MNLGDIRVKLANNQGANPGGLHAFTAPKVAKFREEASSGYQKLVKRDRYRISVKGDECSVDGQWWLHSTGSWLYH